MEQSVEVDAPLSQVFAYVDDFATTKDWMYGLSKIDPVGEQLRGVGAEYDGVMKVGVPLKSRIRCTDWVENELIEISSVKGIKNTQRWTFTDLGEGRTRVDAWIEYVLPGGPAGRAIEKAVHPVVEIAIRHTKEKLKKNVEAL